MTSVPPRWPVRTLTDDDWDDFLSVDSHAFGATMPAELVAGERELHEPGRGIGAFDGTTLVGIATAFSYDLSVPGARLPAAAVSWVGVLPTHRRRGVLSALMTTQLHGVHEGGREPLAVLWASEPQIYGRFGYGAATRNLSLTVQRHHRELHRAAPADEALRLRLVDPSDWKLFSDVYETVGHRRAGVPARDERWWRRAVRDVPSMREGRSELRCVVVEDEAEVRGYALYNTKQSFGAEFGSGEVSVLELMAVDPPALATLYRYLFDLDLMGRTRLWNLPVDDPLMHWLANPRKARPEPGDALYVRLVDLPEALRGRTYAAPVDLVLDVRDELCPWNAGAWRLTAGAGDARCARTEDPPDLSLDVADLGAVYLGGTSLAELALAGRIVERRPGALAQATTAFAHHPAPWSPRVF